METLIPLACFCLVPLGSFVAGYTVCWLRTKGKIRSPIVLNGEE
jgi:hypothetical protein